MELGLSRLKVNILPKFGSITHELTSLDQLNSDHLCWRKRCRIEEVHSAFIFYCYAPHIIHQKNWDYIVLSMVVSKVYKRVLVPE